MYLILCKLGGSMSHPYKQFNNNAGNYFGESLDHRSIRPLRFLLSYAADPHRICAKQQYDKRVIARG